MKRDILTGMVIGVAIFGTILIVTPGSLVHDVNKVLDECQQHLPRDQHCVLTAVVDPRAK